MNAIIIAVTAWGTACLMPPDHAPIAYPPAGLDQLMPPRSYTGPWLWPLRDAQAYAAEGKGVAAYTVVPDSSPDFRETLSRCNGE
jgi:hypothetical protein